MSGISAAELRLYKAAGRAVRNALEVSAALVKPGAKLIDICEEAERAILSSGAKPAFPCNIGVNEIAAHFSPIIGDEDVVPPDALVKIDVGAHVDGYIADAAVTVSLSRRHENLVVAVRSAFRTAVQAIKPGIKLATIGSLVEKTLARWGAKPVTNLSGHLIKRYCLHAGKSVPNVSGGDGDRVRAGEVYAIEPFATTRSGAGFVIEGGKARIFRLTKLKEPKDPELADIFRFVRERFLTLPFSPRWLCDYDKQDAVLRRLAELERRGYVTSYPVLKDRLNGPVAQWEETVITGEDGPEIVTS